MNSNNQQMVTEIIDILSKISAKNYFSNEISADTSKIFFDLDQEELKIIINYVVEALPQRIYLDEYIGVRGYAQELIIKELIFFLAQENKKSPEFADNTKNFRDEIVNELVNNVYINNN